ncbi:hypothetical protein BDY19DRAFT_990053 [Irpex rosettiformis]|uniref:Uncharacterized protein n=1 Tax=Irpex rosettiformis TaxID=378272 RepID=A0ACB8UGJ6_9APHY|nr:hypothetical protein BDY19DRAFT_990053 [Irpex rosettiformis]
MHAARRQITRAVCELHNTCRHASTSANPYPYPNNSSPTPHQIFHLPRSATQADVKARYYELVRIYHPDSPVSRVLPSATVQSRFQAITHAYDVLRGKTSHPSAINGDVNLSEVERAKANFRNLETAMWRAKQQRRAELRVGLDDRTKDAIMLGAIVVTIGAFVAQTYFTRREALQAQHERTKYKFNSTKDPSGAGDSKPSIDSEKQT